jgi:hypothetical protein
MPGERPSMRNIREVLQLRFAQGLSQRAIDASVRLSTRAVNAASTAPGWWGWVGRWWRARRCPPEALLYPPAP